MRSCKEMNNNMQTGSDKAQAETTNFYVTHLFNVKDYVCLVTVGGTDVSLMASQALSANGT